MDLFIVKGRDDLMPGASLMNFVKAVTFHPCREQEDLVVVPSCYGGNVGLSADYGCSR
jgi:hypothetical protein